VDGIREMAKIEIEINDSELWSAVFGSAFESFGTHWEEVQYLDCKNGYDWQPGASVRLVAIDEQTGETTEKNVTLHDLITALPIANKQVYMDLLDLDNYDAVCGDAILQVAVLGEVVYG
jgi:hypothetical protein